MWLETLKSIRSHPSILNKTEVCHWTVEWKTLWISDESERAYSRLNFRIVLKRAVSGGKCFVRAPLITIEILSDSIADDTHSLPHTVRYTTQWTTSYSCARFSNSPHFDLSTNFSEAVKLPFEEVRWNFTLSSSKVGESLEACNLATSFSEDLLHLIESSMKNWSTSLKRTRNDFALERIV